MKILNLTLIRLLKLVVITAFISSYALTAQSQEPQAPTDLIERLQLTPEQRQQIRVIREQNRLERMQINQRLRETTHALQLALDSDTLDEALIEEKLRDNAAAQAALMRARVMTEVRIRRVLTINQLATLRDLRSQAQGFARDPGQNQQPARRDNVVRPNQRNGMAPLFPRRNPAQRPPRP